MVKLTQHRWHKCEEENCFVCEGGLSLCVVCGQAEGTLGDYCPGPKIKKVKVRIAVGVDCDGSWCACGWGTSNLSKQENDRIMMDAAVENIKEGENRYWVTVELEIPEPDENVEEIEGDVESDE